MISSCRGLLLEGSMDFLARQFTRFKGSMADFSHPFLLFVFKLWFLIIGFFFKAFNSLFRTRVAVPPSTDPLLELSALKAARKIRLRKLRSEDLVLAYISRIEQINDLINGMVEKKFEEAVEEARAIDVELDGMTPEQREQIGRERPLLGVPFSLKECVERAGMKCSVGVKANANFVSMVNAPVVDNLLKAGAILLGKSNVPEVCLSFYTTNQIHGQTRNPYDLRRIPGGSSGGEGALIASCGSLVGVGSDIAGSIRFPGHFNGIFGLKTSVGVIDPAGHLPVVTEFRAQMLSLGPLCRYAEDLELMTAAMAGERVNLLRLGEPINESTLKLFFLTELDAPLVERCCNETLSIMDRVVSALEERFNIPVQELKFECTKDIVHIIAASMHSTVQDPVKKILTGGTSTINPLFELLKFVAYKREYTFPTLFVSALEEYYKQSESELNLFRGQRDALAQQVRGLLGENGFIICPAYPTPAPFHGQPAATMFNFAYSGLVNLLSLPAVQCPVGFSKDGLPIGVQIVGPEFSEGALIELAKEMESLFGGWKPSMDN